MRVRALIRRSGWLAWRHVPFMCTGIVALRALAARLDKNRKKKEKKKEKKAEQRAEAAEEDRRQREEAEAEEAAAARSARMPAPQLHSVDWGGMLKAKADAAKVDAARGDSPKVEAKPPVNLE